MIRIFILLLYFFSITENRSQEKEFNFLLNEQKPLISNYVKDSSISIDQLRKTTNLLTNRDIRHLLGLPIAKRKKAFIRHVKHISEKLEEYALEKKKIDDSCLNLISQLEHLRLSIIEKTIINSSPFPTKKDKINMARTTIKSKKKMQYPFSFIKEKEPTKTAYWSPVLENKHKAFKELETTKKIKPKKEMIVVFKKLSYSGSAPKIRTYDLDLDNEWSLKWGDEVHTDVAASRIFASVGYDVDHPYCYKSGKLMLIFDRNNSINNWEQLKDSIQYIYNINLTPFLLKKGVVSEEMCLINDNLSPYLGKEYVKFIKCGLEARPDRVKRLGSFLPNKLYNHKRLELRGSLLLHAFIGNWDTRKENTLLTTVHDGNYNYKVSAVFSDLGTSFGVSYSVLASDFKVGLVNDFNWDVAMKKNNKIHILNPINEFLDPYTRADYNDLRWMAKEISLLDSLTLRKCVSKAKWPDPIEELYFNKIASRRASIIESFDLIDPNPIPFNKNLTIKEDGETIIKNGKLIVDYKKTENPESFLNKKGRKRNYGH